MKRLFNSLLILFWFGCASVAAERPTTEDEVRFFETRIRPVLSEHCVGCHGPKKQRSGLRLDTPEGILKGGDSGEAVLAGQAEKSLLLRAVRHEDGVPKMPPKGRLSERAVADLAHWVRIGAPVPRATKPPEAKGADHWAFRTPVDPPVPAVRDTAWPTSPLDRFVLAQLESRGLRPTKPADKRTLIRRATFDLIGLPPPPEEVAAFLKDESPEAFAKVVDRLLASPHYGERWGRHWLDVARYADSNGLDENVAHGNAWRYRDYVVRAFNDDKPYDRFLLEQVAGDLLPAADEAARCDQLVATGFLALGPKVLAEVDEKKMEMDILDEQVDTLGRSLMALTLGCARCHDHKFDPVSQEDYYGLVGIFMSTRTMEHFKKVAKWYENPLDGPDDRARKETHDREVAARKEAIRKIVQEASERLGAAKPGEPLPKDAESKFPEATRAELKRLREELARVEKNAPVMPSAMGVTEGKITDAAVLRRGNHLTPGKLVQRRFPVVLAGKGQQPLPPDRSGRLELARWLVREDNPLTARVVVNRVWRWHFGQGLVRSTDNFGLLGEKPDNPALLDWLARRFVKEGWSLKKLHRLVLLSATYQTGSTADARLTEADPGNRLNGRSNVRRLEAEAVRDALLAVSGLLDRTAGGSLLHVKNRDYLFDHTSRDATKYDSDRRSIYLPVIRNNLYDVFQLFDGTDATVSSGDRTTTTVATQSLFWLNGELVDRAATKLAEGLLAADERDDANRVGRLYLRAFGRPPTEKETARAVAAVADLERGLAEREPDGGKRRLRAWALLSQVILAANEFVYVN